MAALLRSLVLCVVPVLVGCREHPANPHPHEATICLPPPATAEPWADGICDTHRCEPFRPREVGTPPGFVKGAAVEFSELGQFCLMDASWLAGAARETAFQATLGVRGGDVFPLPGGPVRVHYCFGALFDSDGQWHPSGAGLILDPDSVTLPPIAPGDAVIPFGGEAKLDGDARAEAYLSGDEPSAVNVVLYSSFSHSDRKGTSGAQHGLREGDGFLWGKSSARIVRIVRPFALVKGWVEVALSARSSTGG